MSAQHTPDAFRFDPDAKQLRISNDRILAGLRRFARLRKGRSFRLKDYAAWTAKPCATNTISERFGSWHAALLAARLPGARCHVYTPAELMDILERVWRTVGHPPSVSAFTKLRMSAFPFKRCWGSLPNARRRLADFKAGKISREELLTPTPHLARSKRGKLAPSLRLAILERDRHRCALCGQGPAHGAALEVDHITPICRGGTDATDNLRTLCLACNRGKGQKAA
jgi:hypothetical protein